MTSIYCTYLVYVGCRSSRFPQGDPVIIENMVRCYTMCVFNEELSDHCVKHTLQASKVSQSTEEQK